MLSRSKRVVLLGYGAINTRVAELLRSRSSNARVVGVLVRRPESVPQNIAANISVVNTADDLAALSPDIVLEAASREAVREWGAAALRSARRVVISSASAFVDDGLLQNLRRVAIRSGSQLVLSPGAIAGVEALSAGARLPLHNVRHRIIKSPKSWGTATDGSGNPVDATVRMTFFEGFARDAANRYPLNANVTVVSSLASLGLDRTIIELVSDPSVTVNCHEITAEGSFGSLMVKVENMPLHSNPKSSELAALALVRLAENEVAGIVV